MKRTVTAILGVCLLSIGLVGCGDKSTKKTETTVTTPGGKTTVTTEKEVKQTGDNPPAVRP